MVNSISIGRDVNPLLAARFFARRIAPGGVRAVSFLDESGGALAHAALGKAMGERFQKYKPEQSLDEVMQFESIKSVDGARIVMVVGHIEGTDIVTRAYDPDGRPQKVLHPRVSLASIEAAAMRAGVYLLVAGCKAGDRGMTGPTVNILASQEPVKWGQLLMEQPTLARFFRHIEPKAGFVIGNAGAPAVDQLHMIIEGVSEHMMVMHNAVETRGADRGAERMAPMASGADQMVPMAPGSKSNTSTQNL